MATQLNVRLPDAVVTEINQLAEEYGSQAKVIIVAISKLKQEHKMTTKIGNLALSKDIKPTTLVEVRIKTLANHKQDWSRIEPAHTVPFSDLETLLDFVGKQHGVISHAWNLIGDNSFYTGNGPAGQ